MSASSVDSGPTLSPLPRDYLEALLDGRRADAGNLVMKAVDAGASIRTVYLEVFQPTQYELGYLWESGRINVGQEHYCTAATQLIMSQLYPRLFSGKRAGRSMVAACVEGELHEIGLRMVADFFEMEGWDTTFLGANMPLPDLIAVLEKTGAEILALSASMTFHVERLMRMVGEIRRSKRCSATKIIVGGRALNVVPGLWKVIGADGFARDAESALQTAQGFFDGSPHSDGGGDEPANSKEVPYGPVGEATLALFNAGRKKIGDTVIGRWKDNLAQRQGSSMSEAMVVAGEGFMSETLASIMAVGVPELLVDQMKWSSNHLVQNEVDRELMIANIRSYREVMLEILPEENAREVLRYLDVMQPHG